MLTDNHEVHLDIHTKLTKTEEAQKWDEETWSGMNEHIFSHFAMIKFFMQRAAGQQATAQGAAAAGGAPAEEVAEGPQPAMADETQAVEDNLAF
jgi:hypothetical protein